MAQKLVTENGTLINPGAYASYTVESSPSGLSTTGIIAIVGEAEEGPDFSAEVDLADNIYGPDEVNAVISKYSSGRIVDAFRGAVASSSDSEITGSFSRAIIVKTNASIKASSSLLKVDTTVHSKVDAANFGKSGNLTSFSVSEDAEVQPTTGEFHIIPNPSAMGVGVRVNGEAVASGTITAAMTPDAAIAIVDGLSGVDGAGAVDRGILAGAVGDLDFVVISGRTVSIERTVDWDVSPVVGDLIQSDSANNAGSFIVQTVESSKKVICYKMDVGVDTSVPVDENYTITATADLICYSPVTISSSAAASVPGLSKTLEIAENGTAGFCDYSYVVDDITASVPVKKVEWCSKSGDPNVIVSESERDVTLNVTLPSSGITEEILVEGAAVFSLGYEGTTATATVSGGTLTIAVVGGSGTSPSVIDLKDYPTISDLASYLNTLTGFNASSPSTAQGQKDPRYLDDGVYSIATENGAPTGRIKADGRLFETTVNSESSLVSIVAPNSFEPIKGLPAVTSTTFLAGGGVGGTTDADVLAALTALENTSCNFVVPLFSQDASKDILISETDSSSTYTVDSVNANVLSHVLTMSQLKRRASRQGILSHRGTFTESRKAAENLANFRVALAFEDAKAIGSSGSIIQFQPWMTAIKAAGMQAAGFYRSILNKQINVSGIIHADGSYNSRNSSESEKALSSGLLPTKNIETGGVAWRSDQTTYSRDSNFVFNSIQAVYVADTMSLSSARAMEKAFLGKSVANVNRTLALSTFKGILDRFLALKLTAPSDGAPSGYSDVTVEIKGGAITCSANLKLAGAIYFIPIQFKISEVEQTG